MNILTFFLFTTATIIDRPIFLVQYLRAGCYNQYSALWRNNGTETPVMLFFFFIFREWGLKSDRMQDCLLNWSQFTIYNCLSQEDSHPESFGCPLGFHLVLQTLSFHKETWQLQYTKCSAQKKCPMKRSSYTRRAGNNKVKGVLNLT